MFKSMAGISTCNVELEAEEDNNNTIFRMAAAVIVVYVLGIAYSSWALGTLSSKYLRGIELDTPKAAKPEHETLQNGGPKT